MSRYIGSGQNNQFDVRIQELVSKVKNPGGFLRKKNTEMCLKVVLLTWNFGSEPKIGFYANIIFLLLSFLPTLI